ncbi:MAG: recombination protein RecR [Micavibrio sp.]|nr:recombination protein RecR [Micavibrio sp.]
MPYPQSMVELIEALAKLPGVGRRTAERFAFFILSTPREDAQKLAELLVRVNSQIHYCQECYNLSEAPVCRICADASRDHSVVCVVQEPKDVVAVERSGDFNGIYHVLMGALSPLEGIGPKDIRVKELVERLKKHDVKEVILGTTSDTEGDATSHYLLKQLKPLKIKLTRIAHGVPVGSALEFVDRAALSRAFRERQTV